MTRPLPGFVAVVGLLVAAGSAQAAPILYATSLEGQQIVRVDVGTNATTIVANLPTQADSLVFNNAGNILYTGINTGTLRVLNLGTMASNTLVSGLNGPRDLALEPGGNSVLVSDTGNNRIMRVNLSTNTATPLLTGASPDGIAFDGNGHLYAVLNRNEVREINPTTGATIRSVGINANLDGLTYDPFTNKLYVTSFNNGIYAIDPTAATLTGTFLTNSGGVSGFDGITTDSAGNLFVAARSNFRIYEYNIAGATLTQRTFVNGLDDLAPLTGLGAPGTPEPATIAVLGLGLVGVAGYTRRRKSA
jgi:sugar lactone lactonase YvrE